MNWPSVQEIHSTAAADLAAAAERVPSDKWLAPRSEGKWSPAQVVDHLILAYDVLLNELSGKPGMQIRTKWWQRLMLRLTILPRLLRGSPFPKGTRAPRELREPKGNPDQLQAVASFRDRSARFATSTAEAFDRGGKKLTHPYFGSSGVCDAVLLCARHIQHHAKQLYD